MIYRSRTLLIKAAYIVIDFVCIYTAIYIGYYLRRDTLSYPLSFHDILFDPANPFQLIFALWILTTVFFANTNSLYQTRREVLESFEVWLVLKSVCLSSTVVIIAIFASRVVDGRIVRQDLW